MYGFFSILAICATLLYIIAKLEPTFNIIHHYHNHAEKSPMIKVHSEGDDNNETEMFDDALKKVQESINIVNGQLGGEDER